MKKLSLALTIAAAGISMFAADASAQRLIVERPGARFAAYNRGDRRVGYELQQLNREVRQVRFEIRAFRGEGRRIRYRFDRAERAAHRLNYEYNRRLRSPWEIRRRVHQVRDELQDIRRDMRFRGGRRGWWR